MSFSSIPILDLSLARDAQTKPAFLASLKTALLEVGFLYIRNTGIDEDLIQHVISQGKAFFDLPEEKKLEIQMKNVPSFLGITCVSQSQAIVQLSSLPQATTNSATKSPPAQPTGANKSISQPLTLFLNPPTPFTTISSLQTNGLTPSISPLSVQPTNPTFLKCPPSPANSPL